jgi:hypothetical protein
MPEDPPGYTIDTPAGPLKIKGSESKEFKEYFARIALPAIWDEYFLKASDDERDSYLSNLRQRYSQNRDQVELDFAVKERLAQLLHLEEQFTLRSPDDRFVLLKSAVPLAARNVETARQRYYKLATRSILPLYSAMGLMPFAVAAVWAAWLHLSHGIAIVALGAIELVVAIFLQIPILKMLAQERTRHRVVVRIMGYLALALSSISIIALIFAGLFRRDQYPGIFLEFAGGLGLVLVLYTFYWSSIFRIFYRLAIFYYQRHAKPSEVLLIDLINLAAKASPSGWRVQHAEKFLTFRTSWRGRRRLSGLGGQGFNLSFIDELEVAAKRAERLFAAAAPPGHRDLQSWASDRARRIAAILRAHKRIVLETPYLGDSSIAPSLLNGAVLVVQADWKGLLVVQPELIRQSLVGRFGSRIVLAVLLIGGALAIPWLFPSLVPPTAAVHFRATLLVTAAFSLIRPDLDKAREAFISFQH